MLSSIPQAEASQLLPSEEEEQQANHPEEDLWPPFPDEVHCMWPPSAWARACAHDATAAHA
eukprot:4408825-Prorocentrum_lima.AAC.1